MSFSKEEVKKLVKEALREERQQNAPTPLSDTQRIDANAKIVCEDGKCYSAVITKAKKDFKYKCSNCGIPLPESLVKHKRKAFEPDIVCPNCGSEDADTIEEEE